jgi:hypothetical protein
MPFRVSLVAWFKFKVEQSILYFSVVVGLTETFDVELYISSLQHHSQLLDLLKIITHIHYYIVGAPDIQL